MKVKLTSVEKYNKSISDNPKDWWNGLSNEEKNKMIELFNRSND